MDRNKKRMVQVVVLVAVVCMIAYGVYRGEVSIVLNKAINVCLECIGLG